MLPEPANPQDPRRGIASVIIDPAANPPLQQYQEPKQLQHEAFALDDTWKIKPSQLQCRTRNGKPFLLGQGMDMLVLHTPS